MYSTCLYCTKDLGANEVLETLPIGRRVAFDARQGRLWVVCRGCEKWNLVPFDTRLETIDTCERLFSDTRVRFSTDNIGIARLKEGLELVRIGPAQRPEFAAWRYGDQFGRRRRKAVIGWGVAAVGIVAVAYGQRLLIPILGTGFAGGYNMFNLGNMLYRSRRAVVHLRMEDATRIALTSNAVRKSAIHSRGPDDWSLLVTAYTTSVAGFVGGWRAKPLELTGMEAVDALGRIMPRLNRSGGSAAKVQEAVEIVEQSPVLSNPLSGTLKDLDVTQRLALEMAAHEDTERAALSGELKLLERQWKEAEEVAKIADSLAVSDDVDRQVSGER